MNFLEAIKEMKKGKKVRRKQIGVVYSIPGHFILPNIDDDIANNELDVYDFEAIDWEVVEEKKKQLMGGKE